MKHAKLAADAPWYDPMIRSEATPSSASSRRKVQILAGLLISGVFLYATFRTVSLAHVAEAISRSRPQWLWTALIFIVLAYVLKIARWLMMLRSLGATIGFREAAPAFLGGVALNNVLPFRAGDIIRVLAFQRFTGVPPSGQMGSLVLERLMDLLVLTGILFATLSFWHVAVLDSNVLSGLRLLAIAAVVGVLTFLLAPLQIRLAVRWLERRIPRLRQIGEALLRLSNAVSTLSRPAFLVRILLLSSAAWLAEGGAYFAVGRALGVATEPQMALLTLSVGTLATTIPSSPGYVGTFHFFVARVVSSFGASRVAATAYAVLIHALLWLTTTTSGFLAMAASGLGFRREAKQP